MCSFAVAGALAGLTALSYAELGARHPEAAGAAAYVKEAFGSDRFSQLTGFAVAVVVLISAATIARGTAGYAQAFVALPEALIAGVVVLIFTAVACLGVFEGHQPLSPSQIADLCLAASKMTGANRRAFAAEMTVKYCLWTFQCTKELYRLVNCANQQRTWRKTRDTAITKHDTKQ